MNIPRPRIAVCEQNPHAGEDGVLGSEDRDIIAPAVALLQEAGIAAAGPFPADTIFPLVAHGQLAFDGILSMYHDHGLGPLKTFVRKSTHLNSSHIDLSYALVSPVI